MLIGFGKSTDRSRGLAAMKTRLDPNFSQRLVAFTTVDQPVTINGTRLLVEKLKILPVPSATWVGIFFPERCQNDFSNFGASAASEPSKGDDGKRVDGRLSIKNTPTRRSRRKFALFC